MRPLPITILCVVLFVSSVINLTVVVMSFDYVPFGRAIWTLITSTAAIISFIGLWKMMKWGVYLYLGGYIVGTLSFYLLPPDGADVINKPWLIVFFPLLYCVVVLPYWRRFNKTSYNKTTHSNA